MKLAPAILVKTQEEFARNLAQVASVADRYQYDMIDTDFAANPTLTLADLKRSDALALDLDIMASFPSKYLNSALALSPALIVLHVECQEPVEKLLLQIRASGVKAGLAFNPDSDTTKISMNIDKLDHVLVMGYKAGFAGQEFNSMALENIKKIRELSDNLEIGVDGGVNRDSIEEIAKVGADIAYVNSAIYETADPAKEFSQLLELAK